MYIPFNTLPPEAKIWIYQSSRPLTIEEQEYISAALSNFIDGWQAHGADLKSSFYLYYHRFLVIAIDEADQNATGCSIDASMHTLKEIEKALDINLFDRMSIAYKDDSGMVGSCSRSEFKTMIKDSEIDENTIVFNNMLTTKKEFDQSWEVKAKDSWHARMLPQKV